MELSSVVYRPAASGKRYLNGYWGPAPIGPAPKRSGQCATTRRFSCVSETFHARRRADFRVCPKLSLPAWSPLRSQTGSTSQQRMSVIGRVQPSTSSPFLSTILSSFNDGPLGRFFPCSNFWMVEGLVFKYAAKTA